MTKTIKINGMSCPNCVRHVREALMELDGAQSAEVDLENGIAVFTASLNISDDTIVASLNEFGYSVVSIR